MSVPSEPALKFVEIQLDPTPVDALKDSFWKRISIPVNPTQVRIRIWELRRFHLETWLTPLFGEIPILNALLLFLLDEKVKIMFSNQYYIRLVDLHHNENIVAHNLTNAVALDFHYGDSCIYWSDVRVQI
jgi:hypothetical protein